MSLKKFTSAVFSLAVVLATALQAAASGPFTPLTMLYDPSNGNVKMQNTTTGTGFYQSIELLTLGNGSIGAPSASGTAGYMSGAAANVAGTAGAFLVSNTSQFGANGLYSQVAAGNIGSGMSGMVLQPFPGSYVSGVGPAGTFYDLGNILPSGLTQTQLDSYFITDPETSINGQLNPGKYQVSYTTSLSVPGGVTQLGAVIAVPEPSTYAMAFAGLAFGGFRMWRRRKVA